jgi:hypothetical protein
MDQNYVRILSDVEMVRMLEEKIEQMRAALQLGPELYQQGQNWGTFQTKKSTQDWAESAEAKAKEILSQMKEAAK